MQKSFPWFLIFIVLFAPANSKAQHKHFHTDPRGTVHVPWKLPNIKKVISAGWGFSFGVEAYPRHGYPTASVIDGMQCYTGSYFSLDVEDSFAFNIDEDVLLHFILHENAGHNFTVVYEHNLSGNSAIEVNAVPMGNGWMQATALLKRAQFANTGHGGTDFTLIAKGANPFELQLDSSNIITLSKISITRTYTTPQPATKGSVKITSRDDVTDVIIPVRMGIYDTSGKMPLPAEDALQLPYMDDTVSQLFLRHVGERTDFWPSANRHYFYSHGTYSTNLPVGKYMLVISKGPEYEISQFPFEVKPDDTTNLDVKIKRWIDMPGRGWYSADAHLHITRPKENTKSLQDIMQAEDIHVANLLQMGNAGGTHFNQGAFGKKGQYMIGDHALVSGVEDPRTVHHGHVIVLDVKKSIRNTDEYFLYHKILHAFQKQGASTGYAHVGREWFHDEYGLAIDVPFGLVDFVEIMQYGELNTELWYQFLNLGYSLLPIAGSDFPYLDHPGAVRSYAKTYGNFSPVNWFKAFKAGQTFVTNGPMINLAVNGKPMGSTIDMKKGDSVKIIASASINPQIDDLDYMELLVNGQVVQHLKATPGSDSIDQTYEFTIDKGSWVATRVFGKNRLMAHSAATYLHIDADGHKQKAFLDSLVAIQIDYLLQLKETSIEEVNEIEYWQAGPQLPELWEKNKPEIDKRIDAAIEKYKALLK